MTNAKSYDVRMERLPLFISYPRSGSNWINCILELYFNRPRLRAGPITFLKDRDKRKDYMWFHDHDIFSDLKVKHNKILYLYRNPDDVIFSLLEAEGNLINKEIVDKQANKIKKHYKKYLNKKKLFTIIKYEKLKNIECEDTNYLLEFKKIIGFWGKSCDKEKLDNIIGKVKKDLVINKEVDKRYFSRKLLEASYEKRRSSFKKEYSNYIYDKIVNNNFDDFFS